MARGESTQHKIHYKGKDEDFLVFIDDVDTYKKWLADKSVPLAHFVSSFKVFVTHKQGNQGQYDGAANSTLENEFGTHDDEGAVKKILENGSLHTSEFGGRGGDKNTTQGPSVAH